MADFQSGEERIEYLTQTAIPAALESLSSRHQNLSQAVQYLEGAYMTAGADKKEVEAEANSYLMTALATVTADIESAAVNLEQLLDINMNAVDSLTHQVDLLQIRLRISREQQARLSLQEKRLPHQHDSGLATRIVETRDPVVSNISYSQDMAQRFAQLDEVGVCLSKSSTVVYSSSSGSSSSSSSSGGPVAGGSGSGDGTVARVGAEVGHHTLASASASASASGEGGARSSVATTRTGARANARASFLAVGTPSKD